MAVQIRNPTFTILPVRSLAQLVLLAVLLLWPLSNAVADASGKIVYTKRFGDGSPVVLEVEWTYVRATPSLTFGTPRVIWSGAGAAGGMPGSDGLFFNPHGDLIVGNHQAHDFWKFDPTQTDVVLDGPAGDGGALAFHSLLHPNMEDFLATNAFGQITCGDVACFGVYDHTPLDTSTICAAPLESATNDLLQPVTFIADGNLNMFTIFSDGRDCMGCPTDSGIEYGGGGFASFDLDTTNSTNCSNSMTMTRLIPQEISAAHSMSWDPFLSDANNPQDPHSDFILFANSRIAHVRVDDPGTPGASAEVVSTINMATEGSCASLIPAGMTEFDQGAVNGEGIAMVGDEATGFLALVDYSQNNNGTILDPGDVVCLTAFLSEDIDDIAPLTGLGADPRETSPYFQINAGLNDAWFNSATPGQGFFIIVFPNIGKVFLAWFTYDTERPDESIMAHIGEPGHRWLTAFGSYSKGEATLDIEITKGGVFDSAQPMPTQGPDGTITLRMTGCNSGFLIYDIPSIGRHGVVPIKRVTTDNVSACEELAGLASSKPTAVSTAENKADNRPQAAGFQINSGLNDAWFNPLTAGQGFFLNVFPNLGKVFLAWFTFDTERPDESVVAHLGDPGHRWITALGSYSDNHAELDIEITQGGLFDQLPPATTQGPGGTLTVDMDDCKTGTISYNVTSADLQGEIPIQRIAQDNVALCESLAAQAQQSRE